MQPIHIGDTWYRYINYKDTICEIKLTVVEITAKGLWVKEFPESKPILILLAWKKKYAYQTKEEALKAFIKRKEKHIKILTRILANAKETLELAKTLSKEDLDKQDYFNTPYFGVLK